MNRPGAWNGSRSRLEGGTAVAGTDAFRPDRVDPFDIGVALDGIEVAIRKFPKAAMFELAERGYATPFQQLVACVVSIRTRDETSLPLSEQLFRAAPTPAAIAALSEAEIDALIRPATFARRKAVQIRAMAGRVVDEFGGELPCDDGVMRSFAGVGVKCANLALGIACGQPRISVDVHVHRIVNRWGYVRAATPEKTTVALEAVLPMAQWTALNAKLVPFGKHVCTGTAPRCSTCPVRSMCPRIGVTSHR